jgi:hypothetical protein
MLLPTNYLPGRSNLYTFLLHCFKTPDTSQYSSHLNTAYVNILPTYHIHKVHYVGIHHILCNKPIVSCLNSSQILLLPFVLYPFSAPGYFVHQFFFLHTSTQVPPALDHPGLIISLAPTPILLLIQALASRSNFHVHPLHHTTYYYFHEITKSG